MTKKEKFFDAYYSGRLNGDTCVFCRCAEQEKLKTVESPQFKQVKVCEACESKQFRNCKDCGEREYKTQYVWVEQFHRYFCSTCHNNRFFCCASCGGRHDIEDAIQTNRGTDYCQPCFERAFTQCARCHFDISRNQIRNVDGEVLCVPCAQIADKDENSIFGYHSGLGRQDMSKNARFKIGIELEKEDVTVKDRTNWNDILENYGWITESDGSLDSYLGFECVSPVLALDDKETLDWHFDKLKKIINAKSSSRCGGHIHVSDTQRRPVELLKDIRGYLPLLYAMYLNRITGRYCEAIPFEDYGNDKYKAVNVTNKTLEFRLFSSPKNVEVLKFRLELLRIILKNPRYSMLEVIDDITRKRAIYKLLRKVYTQDQISFKVQTMEEQAKKYEEIGQIYSSPKIETYKKRVLKAVEENRAQEFSPSVLDLIAV